MKCPKCQAKNLEGAELCRQCGAKLEKACPNCGATNLPQYRFCGTCGHNLAPAPEPMPTVAPQQPIPTAKEVVKMRPRVPTGIEGLDNLLSGGLQQNKVFLVSGEAGTGKTIFCMQYVLAGANRGENAVYVSIDEKPSHLMEDAQSLGWDLKKYVDEKRITLLDVTPYFADVRAGKEKAIDVRTVVTDLTKQIQRIKAQRLVIDPIAPLIFGEGSTVQVREYIRSLIFSIADNLECTTLVTSGIPSGTSKLSQYEVEEFVVSGIIVLSVSSLQARRVRTLYIRKMRGTPTDLNDHVFEILPERGIVVREAA